VSGRPGMRPRYARHSVDAGYPGRGMPISIAESEAAMSYLSAHADYRHEDYYFARTQSRALSELEWEHSEKPLQSWSQILYPALGVAGTLLAALEIIH
jgi:hypothetical protein